MSERSDLTREQQLETTLHRLLLVTTHLVDKAGWDPNECKIVVSAKSEAGERAMATVTLAECFSEAEDLVGPVFWTLRLDDESNDTGGG